MLTVVDEAGCTGFKFDKGSTEYFLVTMVHFQNNTDAEEVAKVIETYREQVKWNKEFHFKSTPDKLRHGFLELLPKGKLFFRAIVIDKRKLGDDFPKKNKNEFYKKVVELLVKHDPQHLQDSTVIVDRSSDNAFQTQLKVHMRQTANSYGITIKDIKFKDWRQNSLVQIADMLCGSLFRKFERNNEEFYEKIARHERDLLVIEGDLHELIKK